RRGRRSFPTRRSSDLDTEAAADVDQVEVDAVRLVQVPADAQRGPVVVEQPPGVELVARGEDLQPGHAHPVEACRVGQEGVEVLLDRKSTRLNSSHVKI